MNPFLKLWYFLRTGSTRPETWKEEKYRLRRGIPRIGGIATIFITFCVLAIIAKLVVEGMTGTSFHLSVEGLVSGFVWLIFALIALIFIVFLRKLFVWRYGDSESSGEYPGTMGCGMFVFIIIGAVGLLTLYIRHSYEASRKAVVVPLVTADSESGPKAERANTPELVERQALIGKLDDLYAVLNSRWRSDVIGAGASDAPGVTPPMLELTAKSPGRWLVKNLARTPACVRLVRVVELPGKLLQRCRLDTATECVEIGVGTSREISLAPEDGSPGCRDAKLEFRVGTPTLPEPSWWTATALRDLDDPVLALGKSREDWSAARLRSEITLLETMAADPGRAARWRRELDELAHRAKP
jgi:uncharacterized membrane protein